MPRDTQGETVRGEVGSRDATPAGACLRKQGRHRSRSNNPHHEHRCLTDPDRETDRCRTHHRLNTQSSARGVDWDQPAPRGNSHSSRLPADTSWSSRRDFRSLHLHTNRGPRHSILRGSVRGVSCAVDVDVHDDSHHPGRRRIDLHEDAIRQRCAPVATTAPRHATHRIT